MIKKLDIMKDTRNVIDKGGIVHAVANFTAIEKINEIVEILNAITIDVDGTKCVDGRKAPTNPYTKQQKWIGCVCRFWYDNPDNTVLDYLGKIQTGENGIEYYGKETYDWFPHCEPILPTDNVIYKGGDNDNPAN